MRVASIFLFAVFLSGCAAALEWANRPPVTQGNLLNEEDIAALETGMTKGEVRQRIGGPVLSSGFNPDSWEYVYYETVAGAETGEKQHLRLHFDGDRLVRIDDNYAPPAPPTPLDEDLPPEPDPMEQPPAPSPDDPGPQTPNPM